MMFRRRNVALITDAKKSPVEDWKHRRREYALLQGARIPCLLLALGAYMWLHNGWLAGIFAAISIPLPWIAVVLANAVGETQDPRSPRVYKPEKYRSAYVQLNGQLPGHQAHELVARYTDSNSSDGASTQQHPGHHDDTAVTIDGEPAEPEQSSTENNSDGSDGPDGSGESGGPDRFDGTGGQDRTDSPDGQERRDGSD